MVTKHRIDVAGSRVSVSFAFYIRDAVPGLDVEIQLHVREIFRREITLNLFPPQVRLETM